MKDCIIILDFGSQYTHLIKLRLNELHVHSIIEQGDITIRNFKQKYTDVQIKGIILSGGAHSVYEKKISFDTDWLDHGTPVLGICYGHQLLALHFGGDVKKTKGEYGKEIVTHITSNELLQH